MVSSGFKRADLKYIRAEWLRRTLILNCDLYMHVYKHAEMHTIPFRHTHEEM